MGGTIISGFILGICALVMIVIGIWQIKSQKPVGFYTGEKPPEEKDVSDVCAWNRKHGMMWILYGVCIESVWVCGRFIDDELLMLIPFAVGLLLPIPCMILYHKRLVKRYIIKRTQNHS